MKKFLQEFKDFTLRGNALNMAVGVIIGAAFQGIVKSLTDDLLSPLLGLFLNTDFSMLSLTINDVQIRYGSFLTAVINFLIMAFVIFSLIKLLSKVSELGKKEEAQEVMAKAKKCRYCCSEIDLEATRCPHCTSQLE